MPLELITVHCKIIDRFGKKKKYRRFSLFMCDMVTKIWTSKCTPPTPSPTPTELEQGAWARGLH